MSKERIIRALVTLRDLTKTEALAVFEFMKRGKKMKRGEIAKLIEEKNISTKTNTYSLINRLIKKKVIVDAGDSYFEPIDVEFLIYECRDNLAKMEDEIQGFEYEENWEDLSPHKESRIISADWEIKDYLCKARKQFNISFRYKKEDGKNEFWEAIKDIFSKEEVKEGPYNLIFLEDIKKPQIHGGVIFLSKTHTPKGEEIFFGSLIFDPELKNLFKNHGKRK